MMKVCYLFLKTKLNKKNKIQIKIKRIVYQKVRVKI